VKKQVLKKTKKLRNDNLDLSSYGFNQKSSDESDVESTSSLCYSV